MTREEKIRDCIASHERQVERTHWNINQFWVGVRASELALVQLRQELEKIEARKKKGRKNDRRSSKTTGTLGTGHKRSEVPNGTIRKRVRAKSTATDSPTGRVGTRTQTRDSGRPTRRTASTGKG